MWSGLTMMVIMVIMMNITIWWHMMTYSYTDFGSNSVPDGRTVQRLVAKFRKTDAQFPNWVADANKAEIVHCSA